MRNSDNNKNFAFAGRLACLKKDIVSYLRFRKRSQLVTADLIVDIV